ncbi:hypothetical protein D3C73_1366990 [compost metagenome]
MRRKSFFNAVLTRSTLVDDGAGHGLVRASGRLDHVPRIRSRYGDGFQCAVDGVLVRRCTLGTFLIHYPDLHLDNLE